MPRHRRGWAMGGAPQQHAARHSPLLIAMLEPALLILLKERPTHGYMLLAELEQLGMGTIHPSVVYRTLREMEDLGWILSNLDSVQTQGPPRRTYQLTTQGELALQNWSQELTSTSSLITILTARLAKNY